MRNNISFKIEEETELKNPLEETVLNYLKLETEDYVQHLSRGLEDCESPIEKMFLIALNGHIERSTVYEKLKSYFDAIEINGQENVKCTGLKKDEIKNYRVDFLIELTRDGETHKFAIECDGYEFHSDNESFSKDRNRDLILLSNGIHTIRISGKDILDSPHICASNVLRTIYRFLLNTNEIE